MTYKKYIEKNGKLYGPYTYHSKRVDGKVISEYHGRGRGLRRLNLNHNINFNKLLTVFAYSFMLVFFIFFFVNFVGDIGKIPGLINSFKTSETNFVTGNVALNLETTYLDEANLNGIVTISLREGELIPANTLILIETQSGEQYEYALYDVLDEEVSIGDFYLTGLNLEGNGEGYGVEGTKFIYPVLEFSLKVSESSELIEEVIEEEQTEEQPVDEPIEESNEEPVEEILEKQINETIEEPTEETTNEPTDENEFTGEINSETNDGQLIEETNTETTENNLEDNTKETTNEPANENEITGTSDSSESPESSDSSLSESPITGSIIFNLFAGFLQGLSKMTGYVVSEGTTSGVAQGIVSFNSPYQLILQEGQTVSLVSGSILDVNSKGILNDSVLSIAYNEQGVVISTDYYEEEKGFGKDYLTGEVVKQLKIDLNTLNITPEEGNLLVKISYQETEILSLSTQLALGETTSVSNETIFDILNQTDKLVNQTLNETLNITEKLKLSNVLTEEEKEILLNEFGNESVKTTKAELFNGRLIVKHEVGDYWIEYSYNSEYYSEEINDSESIDNSIKEEIQDDMIKWLKDLAFTLSKKDDFDLETLPDSNQISGLITNHSII